MPHNLYLHSSIVQTRRYPLDLVGRREAIRFATIDSNIALSIALAINAAILILSAATFHRAGRTDVAGIQEAYQLLTPMLGVTGASTLFAVALLAAGQMARSPAPRRPDRDGGIREHPPPRLGAPGSSPA